MRGLLLLLTVFCIWLGMQVERARKQARAIEQIEAFGGGVLFNYDSYNPHGQPGVSPGQPSAPAWLRRAVGEEYFRRVESVWLAAHRGQPLRARRLLTDHDLAVFNDLPHVRVLDLRNTPGISDDGLAHLAGLSKLESLSLDRTAVAGHGLRHLRRLPNLQHLGLAATPLTDAGLAELRCHKRLQSLDLTATRITDKGLSILPRLISLQRLQLAQTGITDAGLEHLWRLTGLKQLSIRATNGTAHGVAALRYALPGCSIDASYYTLYAEARDAVPWPDDYRPTHQQLAAKVLELEAGMSLDNDRPQQPVVAFRLSYSDVSDESLLRLLLEMPRLKELNLRTVLVGDRLAGGLRQLAELSSLALVDSRISDTGLRHLARLANLRELSLRDSRVTDAGLLHLAALRKLEALDVRETHVTDHGLFSLQQALPACRIVY
ncbi:MAG: hypothetical protein WD847_13360 [Pirellulales bacterium]